MTHAHRNFSSTALRLCIAVFLVVSGAFAVLGADTTAAQTGSTVTIDFETVTSDFYTGHQEDGFNVVARIRSTPFRTLRAIGSREAPISGNYVFLTYSPTTAGRYPGDLIITRTDGGSFAFSSVDLNRTFGRGPADVNIKGYVGGESGTLVGENRINLANYPYGGGAVTISAQNLAGRSVDTLVFEMISSTDNSRGGDSPMVDNIVLVPPPPVDCTLNAWTVSTHTAFKEAIACFNAKTTAGTYTITLGGDIALLGATPAINNSTAGVELLLDGAGFTMDGGGASSTRPIEVSANTTATIRNLTVQNAKGTGTAGGAVANSGTLTIIDSRFFTNTIEFGGYSGGAIINYSTMTIEGSVIRGNQAFAGSGISNSSGQMEVRTSTISNNRASYCQRGGGIDNEGRLVVELTTIAANFCEDGAGVYNGLISPDAVIIRNSTIRGNNAGRQGGGVFGAATLKNNIISDNTAPGGGGDLSGGTHVNLGYNLIGGSPLLLSPLGDYGGATQTVALLPGSPAIDAGDPNCPPTDQRGVARVGGCDIGAFEARGFTLGASSGSGQTAEINANFASPLVVSVSSAFTEPVNGGRVIFTAPGSGASLAITTTTATISSGSVSQPVTANGTVGGYTVNADTRGNLGGPAGFSLTNSPIIYTPVAGFGNALDFDGSDEFVEVPYAAALNPDSFTVEGWVYPRNNSRFQAPFSSRDTSTAGQNKGWTVYVTDQGKWAFWTASGATWNTLTGPDVQLNQWTHVAVTYSGGTGTLYIDGVQVATKTGMSFPKNDARPFRIGAADDGTGTNYHTSWYFDGRIDDVRVWNGVRTQAQIAEYRLRTIQQPANEASLAAYWPFNETTGNVLLDITGGHDGALQRMENADWRPGPSLLDNALDFDGANDFVSVPYAAALNPDSFTVEGWVYPRNNSRFQSPFSSRDASTAGSTKGWNIYISDAGNWEFWAGGGGGWNITQGPAVQLNQWTHVAVTYSGNTVTLYINGVQVATKSGVNLAKNTAKPFRIGAADNGTGASNSEAWFFDGLVDEVRVWNIARSAAQIDAYRYATIEDTSKQAALVANWSFNQSRGAGLPDLTGNHNGSLQQMDDADWQASLAVVFPVRTDEDVAVSSFLKASDNNGVDALTFAVTTQPAHGTLSNLDANTGAFTYTPNAGYCGADTFQFQVNDGGKDSNIATQPILIACAPLRFTVENPGVQTAQIACPAPVLEDFDSIALGAQTALTRTIGVYTGPMFISAQSQYGGAELPNNADKRYISVSGSQSYELALANPAGYFGFWWTSGTVADQIKVTLADGSVETLSAQALVNAAALVGQAGTAGGFYGNPTAQFKGQNAGQAYAFVSIYAPDANRKITKITFYSPATLESDNHTACADIIARADQSGTGLGDADFGDAPDTYATSKAASGAVHSLYRELRLGGLSDNEASGFTSTDADGDDTNGVDDEDALIAPLPALNAADTGYALNGIPVYNNSGGPAILAGWIDFNRNGAFDASEGISTTVPSNAVTQTVNLSWSGLSGLNAGAGYARLRLSDQVAVAATGPGGDGEVEDYALTITPGATLTITKQAVGGSGVFTFTSAALTPNTFTLSSTVASTDQRVFTNLPAGVVDINEALPAGWSLTDIQCTGGNPSYTATGAQVTLAQGDDVTCTFENTQLGTFVIEKRTAPAGSIDFGFTITDTASIASTFVLSDTEKQTFANVVPGAYTVTEEDSTALGNRLTELRCDDGSSATPSTTDLATRTAVVNVDPGETVTCTYVNTEDDYIVVIKRTDPAPLVSSTPDVFNFSLSGAASDTFTLADFWATSDVYFRQVTTTGVFTITETSPSPAYNITDIQCAVFPPDANGAPTQVVGDTQSGSVAVNLAQPGQAAICVFTNTATGSITIEKEAYPADNTTFNFSSPSLAPSSFALTPSPATPIPSQTFTSTVPGSYTVGETTPAGWILDTIDCQTTNKSSTWNVRLADGQVDIDLAPGDDVTCTFVNRRPADLTVVKNTVGGDGAFEFSTTTLLTGTAALTGTFSLTTTGGTAQRAFTDLLPGLYDVVETVPHGWTQSGATCSNGDTPDDVFLLPGDSVTCTITNTKQSSITLVKDTIGGGGVFTFTSQSLTPSPFELIAGQTGTFSGPLVSRVMDSGGGHTCALREDGSVACWGDNAWGQAVDQTGPYIQVSGGGFGTCALTPEGAVECWGDNAAGELDSRPGPYTQVSTGESHTCAVLADDGSLDCWGDSADGKLNAPADAFSQISAGPDFTCGVTTAGAVECWGNNSQGQLNAPAGTFTQVSAGGAHACALNTTGAVACWGANASGQGTGIPGVFTQVSAGFDHNCGLTPTGAIKCWGSFSQGQSVDLPGPYTAISTGNVLTCALTPAGAVQCWGLPPFVATPPSANIGQPWQRVFADLPAGTYDVSESVPQDWKLTSATCSDGSDPSSIALAAGEDVTCTFANTKQARLTIIKATNPPGGSGFDFTINGGMTTTLGANLPASFVLDPGAYQVTELVPAGWQLTGIFCNAAAGSWTAGADNAQLTLAAGDDVRCFFSNSKLPTLTIIKQALPADGTDFDFEIAGAASNTFALDDAATDDNDGVSNVISYTLPVGSYVLTETTTLDWNISLQCQSATGSSSFAGTAYDDRGGVKTGAISFDLAAGDNVTCTYRNFKSATLTVEKKTVGGDDTFQVTRSLFSLPRETYDLTTQGGSALTTTLVSQVYLLNELEEIAPPGWLLTDATCTGVTNNAWQRNGDKLAFTPSAGDNITCTFTNTRSGTITVRKDAAPADDTRFKVVVGDPTPKSTSYYVQDPSNPGFSVTGLPGAYQILEGLQQGWDFPTTTCQSSSGQSTFRYTRFGVNIDLAAGDDVLCSLRNEKKGSLTVVKNSVGGDAAFTFSSAALGVGDFPLTTVNGTAQRRFDDLTPRTYDLSEVIPAGWQQGAVHCSDGSTPPNVTVGPGEDVTCTFTNSKLDTIVIEKRTVGGDGAFTFSSNLPSANSFNLKTVKGVARRSFTNLTPGTYNFAEIVPQGWAASVADPLCSNGDNASSVTLTAGETVVCTFVNLKQDTIVVEKRTVGGDGVFEFTSPQLGTFPITTTNGLASQSFDNQAPGTYSITETVPAGWALLDATCDNGDDPTSITLAAGETVRCTFDNIKLGSITVVKNTVGGDATFNFTGDLGAFPVTTVGGTGQRTAADLQPGTYAITETVPAGWDATNASCSDNSNPSAIDLAPGENVICIFDNTKLGSLTVVKNAVGGDTAFTFNSQALGSFVMTTTNGAATPQLFADLVPGSYDLAEVVPSGWRQTRASCSDGSRLPNVDVAAGEDVTCTFENAQESTIVVAKFALGGSEPFTYTSQALGTFVLTPTNSVAQRVFSGLTAGPYDITEAAAPGWVSVDPDPVCSNGDRASKLFLADGETIYCLFTNVKQDTIIIEKRTTGGDGTFDFTGSLGNLQLTTSGGYTRTIVSGLNPGTYTISETIPAGWTQSSATCDNGDAPGSVTLGLGEVVTCTFENTKLGKIEVLKRAVGGDDTFSFSSPQFGAFDLKTAGTAKRDFFDLAAGTYAITETVVAGWDLSSVSCTDSSNPAAISLATGEEVTCFFTNSRQGSITIIKESTGGDGVFDFSSQALGSFVLTTTNGTAQRTFTNLPAGSYDISENVPADWAANGATCSDGSDPANISLAYNEDVICTYRNLKRSNLTVIKTTVSGDDVFNFDSSRFGSFAITTTNGTAQQSFTNLLPGVYDVTESLSQKWEQVNATCDNGDTPAHVTLNPGDDVICTIENRERSVVIYLPQILKASRPMIYLPLILYQQPQVVYSNNFNQTAGSEWSTVGRSATAPLGERFLGEFSNETTSLSLSGLPVHSAVTVSFDLYIIRSWDGNQVERPTAAEALDLLGPAALDQLVGPDRWVMRQGNETLLDTSFANIPIFKQAYPGGWGVGDYPAQTGSSAVGTLGYILGPTSDATYRIVRTFSHSAADLSLSFEAIGLQNIEDESWGIDNIVVMVE